MSMSKYDNDFKQKTLLKGIDKKVASVKRDYYKKTTKKSYFDNDGELAFVIECNSYEEMIKKYRNGYNYIDCAERLNESKYRRAKRVRDKIARLVLSNKAIFITLTFNDKTFAKTDDLRRRRLVQRYLKQNCKEYVANIDFGSNEEYIDDYGNKRIATEREHYHALVSNDINFDSWYKYGAIKVERVRPLDNSTKRIARYITKLTNHALKVGGIVPRLIYSRNIA